MFPYSCKQLQRNLLGTSPTKKKKKMKVEERIVRKKGSVEGKDNGE